MGKAFQEGDSVSKGMEVRYREMSGQKFLGLKGKLRSRACPLEVYVTLREGFSQGRQKPTWVRVGGS